jgi:hypothetical protein
MTHTGERPVNRPIYENAETLANEKRIIDKWCEDMWERTGKHPVPFKLARKDRIVYALSVNNQVTSFAEVKKRHVGVREYKELILSFSKFDALRRMMEFGFKSLLVFEFEEGIHWLDVKSLEMPRVSINGRKDRGDDQDFEPVIWIPRNLWIQL